MKSNTTNEIRNTETYKVDAFRAKLFSEYVTLDFGKISNIDNESKTINTVASVSLDPKLLRAYILKLVSIGIAYEESYGKDIGIRSKLIASNEKEEV